MTASTFTLADLLEWSRNLPEWQRDGLRRVLVAGDLNAKDTAELVDLAKRVDGKTAVPAAASDVREPVPSAAPVCLLELSDIARVNALSKGPLKFSPEGLTVVYGDNGAGKSGVIRILKKACRAAVPGGDILPDVFDDPISEPASATISYRVGTGTASRPWVAGQPAPAELSAVTVFDCECAVHQVEKQNRISYTPEILTVFQRLASVCDEVATRLRAERDALGVRAHELTNITFLLADSAAAKAMAGLSAKTDVKALRKTLTLTPADDTRRETLRATLKDNPAVQAQSTRAAIDRVHVLEGQIRQAADRLSDITIENLRVARESEGRTATAAATAATAFAEKSELPGVGGEVWKELWEAARRYSSAAVYPNQNFPNTTDDAKCVLCQQALAAPASERMRSFEDFISSDLERKAEEARNLATAAQDGVAGVVLPSGRAACATTSLDRTTSEGRLLREFLVSAKLRRRAALKGRPVAALKPRPDLSQIISKLDERLSALKKVESAEGREQLLREHGELEDRATLTPLRDALEREIARLQSHEKLSGVIDECDTTKITRKAREVAKVVITGQLRSAFTTNLGAVGFASVGVEVVLGDGERAVHPYKVSLVGGLPKAKPADVLSEGERTCVALAGLLAELEVTGNKSGIVLDDPVSSLDHRYREAVAERLVAEAKARQVVVFTHDVVFFWMLRKHSTEAGVPRKEQSVERGHRRHGVVKEGPPWVALQVGSRLARLQHELKEAEKKLKAEDRAGYENDVKGIYTRLRETWERAIEEKLLAEVVQRFAKDIQTKKLKHLCDISDEDITTVTAEMTRCSNFVHSEPGAVNTGLPEPAVVREHIKKLEDWIASIDARRRK